MPTSKEPRFERVQGWTQRNMGLILILAVALMTVSLGLILKGNADTAQNAEDFAEGNRNIVCTQANSTALGYRVALPEETFDHFAARMRAQRLTLRASRHLGCAQIEGLRAFPARRSEALQQIAAVLHPEKPQPREQVFGSVAVPGAEEVVPEQPSTGSEQPGPQGPPGEQGEQGDPGEPGQDDPQQPSLTDPVCDLTLSLGVAICQ